MEDIQTTTTNDVKPSPTEAYGPNIDDGTYLTPFRITVFYNPHSAFETAIAVLSERAQLGACDVGVNTTDVYITPPEHPTPEVLAFGNTLARNDIDELLARGIELVHILLYHDGQKDAYMDDGVMYDQRIICFAIEDLYMHMLPVNNLAAVHLLEHLTCATFPTYKPTNADVSRTTGLCLITALGFQLAGRPKSTPLGLSILELCSGIDGFDKISEAVLKGKTIHEVYEHSANVQLGAGLLVSVPVVVREEKSTVSPPHTTAVSTTACWAVNVDNLADNSYVGAIIDLMQAHPGVVKSGADFVMLYAVECHVKDKMIYPGWRVVLFKIKGSILPADVLKPHATGSVCSDLMMASAWLTTLSAMGLLTFLYPQKTVKS